MERKPRFRYAPSPTGVLHIGGARTALFNYLAAKNMGGEFILRIEDTDFLREVKKGEKSQIEGLEWLGIEIDVHPGKEDKYGPYRQTERLEIYDEYVENLLEKGYAYECYCTVEELEKDRKIQKNSGVSSPKYNRKCLLNPTPVKGIKPSVRLFMPKNIEFKWNDMVRGEISINSNDIGDWVIRKSNGMPTYSFANVIDDGLMEITHVMRGEEHISNTPKQIYLYDVLDLPQPKFGHMTIITGNSGKKLSKRDESVAQFIHLYKEHGYIPEAVLNFIALLGWSPEGEEEIFSKEELIKIFNIDRLSKAPSKLNVEKLKWTNNYYIKNLNDKKLIEFLRPFLSEYNFDIETEFKIMKVFQSQLLEGRQIYELAKIFSEDFSIDEETKSWALDNKKIIELLLPRIETLKDFNQSIIKLIINTVGKETGIKGKNLMMPLRNALTGRKSGPDVAMIMEIFGKEKTLDRLRNFVK